MHAAVRRVVCACKVLPCSPLRRSRAVLVRRSQGYGTRLMNHLKEAVKSEGITDFVTYADNYAVGYFQKQGFTKVVTTARERWYGYIKDYDGGTLMECAIHSEVNYLNIPAMIALQRQVRQAVCHARSVCGSHGVKQRCAVVWCLEFRCTVGRRLLSVLTKVSLWWWHAAHSA